MKVSITTLKKSAILATLFTGYGSAFIYYKIQKRVSSGSYYKKTEDAVRLNKEAMAQLGGDFRMEWVYLRDKFNKVNTHWAQLKIPVRGTSSNGTVEMRAVCKPPGSDNWELEYVQLHLDTRPKQTLPVAGSPPPVPVKGAIGSAATTPALA